MKTFALTYRKATGETFTRTCNASSELAVLKQHQEYAIANPYDDIELISIEENK